MSADSMDGAGTGVAVLDKSVLDALGQLKGNYDSQFVTRMILMLYGDSPRLADSAQGGSGER